MIRFQDVQLPSDDPLQSLYPVHAVESQEYHWPAANLILPIKRWFLGRLRFGEEPRPLASTATLGPGSYYLAWDGLSKYIFVKCANPMGAAFQAEVLLTFDDVKKAEVCWVSLY